MLTIILVAIVICLLLSTLLLAIRSMNYRRLAFKYEAWALAESFPQLGAKLDMTVAPEWLRDLVNKVEPFTLVFLSPHCSICKSAANKVTNGKIPGQVILVMVEATKAEVVAAAEHVQKLPLVRVEADVDRQVSDACGGISATPTIVEIGHGTVVSAGKRFGYLLKADEELS